MKVRTPQSTMNQVIERNLSSDPHTTILDKWNSFVHQHTLLNFYRFIAIERKKLACCIRSICNSFFFYHANEVVNCFSRWVRRCHWPLWEQVFVSFPCISVGPTTAHDFTHSVEPHSLSVSRSVVNFQNCLLSAFLPLCLIHKFNLRKFFAYVRKNRRLFGITCKCQRTAQCTADVQSRHRSQPCVKWDADTDTQHWLQRRTFIMNFCHARFVWCVWLRAHISLFSKIITIFAGAHYHNSLPTIDSLMHYEENNATYGGKGASRMHGTKQGTEEWTVYMALNKQNVQIHCETTSNNNNKKLSLQWWRVERKKRHAQKKRLKLRAAIVWA